MTKYRPSTPPRRLVSRPRLIDELRAGRLSDVKTQIVTFWLDRLFSGAWPWPEFERVG